MIPGSVGWARWWAEFSSERFDDSFRWAILHAISESRSWGHGYIDVEHLFAGCVRSDDSLHRLVEQLCDPVVVIQDALELGGSVGGLPPLRLYGRSLSELWRSVEGSRGERGIRPPPRITARAERAIGRAEGSAGKPPVSAHHLLVASLEEPASLIASAFAARGIPRARVEAWVRSRLEWGPLLDLAREAAEHDPPG